MGHSFQLNKHMEMTFHQLMLNLQVLVRNFPVFFLALELEHLRQWLANNTCELSMDSPSLCRCWKHRCNHDWQHERHGDPTPDWERHESDYGYWSGEKARSLDESVLHLLHLSVIFHCHSSNHGLLYFLLCSETQDRQGPVQEPGEFVCAIVEGFFHTPELPCCGFWGQDTHWTPKSLNLFIPQEGVWPLKC